MYPVSEKFLRTINQNARRFYWIGTITTKAGQTYILENKDIVNGSGYITRSCCGSNEIELGSVYAAELGISLILDVDRYSLDDAEITLSFHTPLTACYKNDFVKQKESKYSLQFFLNFAD